ncbi:MAG TPA: hypothetical protein VEH80_06000 [Candidatus Bathyarchaeia archaeon]|nr:hypothetical protein [Candidatus Bathyarchaeia archaeon]
MRAVLGETFRLLGTHLYLFTLLSLTVWLPTHVLLNYLEFFEPGEDGTGRALRIVLTVQVVLDPFVVSAMLSALARLKHGHPAGYWQALAEGFSAWPRLMLVRFLVLWVLLLPSFGWLAVYSAGPVIQLLGGLVLIALSGLILALLVRFALVDSVVVLGGATPLTAWRQAAELTAGQRWPILWTATIIFVLVFGLAALGGQAFRSVPVANHFVARVLFDCVLAVSQSLFTIALFLFYWRRQGIPAPVVPAAT